MKKLMRSDQFREIIQDELGRHASKFPGNHHIVCAIRLLDACGRRGLVETIELSLMISESWTDIELSDKQIESIIEYLGKIISESIEYQQHINKSQFVRDLKLKSLLDENLF